MIIDKIFYHGRKIGFVLTTMDDDETLEAIEQLLNVS
jgi:hypothetical protein